MMRDVHSQTPRRVLVTGGSRGIGAAIATTYAQAGWAVLAPTRDELDLADLEALESRLSSDETLKDVDAIVHAAGINHVAPLAEMSLTRWREVLDVNLGAAFLLLKVIAPGMARRGWGRVVFISSAWSQRGRSGRATYAASKGGLDALMRVAALEFSRNGVLVNGLAPGFVDTDMTRQNNSPEMLARLEALVPVGRLASPDEVAQAAFWLGSDENQYVTGQVLVQDGGFTIQGGLA